LDTTVNCSLINNWTGTNVGVKLMAKSPLWKNPNNANNISGFSLFPSGLRMNNGNFGSGGSSGLIWLDTEYSNTISFYISNFYSFNNLSKNIFATKDFGLSVRCLKD
jgi:uncharacterized protein (TIGR02145 family)